MQLSTLKTGKRFVYSIVPAIAVLVVLGHGLLVGLAILMFGPLTPEFQSGFNGFSDLVILLAFPFLLPIFHSIWFNYRIIRTIFGKVALGRKSWRWNTVIVALASVWLGGSVLYGLFYIFTDAYRQSNLLGSLLYGLIYPLVLFVIMYYPYWLKRKFPELKVDETVAVTTPPNSSPPPAQAFVGNPVPLQASTQTVPPSPPSSSPPPTPQAPTPPSPEPPSDNYAIAKQKECTKRLTLF